MRLLSLELNGFKSFAQKTKIEFMPGMTGIVGPNGSGKSNIIEAVRWVMGEQSAKDLRGTKMTDVIFAGSDTRKPLNRAEVSITFDNQDHYLSSDYSEITITRKLYRSGESQYLINGQECRLKDVLDLFMDSGLGRESFSIISQGRVEAIFNGKSSDRRAVIEEVAGVAKYKQNKTTAQKRLVDTTANLHRVGDIISELETQLEPLAQQSALAKEYQSQKKQFDQLDRTQTVFNIETFQQQKEAQLTAQSRLQRLSDNYEKQINQQNKDLNTLKQQQATDIATKDQLQAQLLQQTQEIAKLNNQLTLTSERSSQQKLNLAQIEKQIHALEEQKAKTNASLEQFRQTLGQQQQEIQVMKQKIIRFEKLDAKQQNQVLSRKIEQLQNEQVDQMQALTTVHNQKTFITRNHEQDSKRHLQSKSELNRATAQFKQLQDEILRQQTQRETLARQLTEQRQRLTSETQQRQELRVAYDTTQKKWYQALGKVQSLQARRSSLKSLETEYAGFYQGVKSVLQQRQQFNGLYGPVAELINVPENYTLAIETVLGAQLQNLVVDRQATGRQIINYLVKNRGGRATILPLDTLASHSVNRTILAHVDNLPGYLGVASDLISCEPQYQMIVNHLLSNTIIADTLSHATVISQHTQHRFKIITIDGQLISASGSMTGGANRQQRQGILSRQNEIEQLDAQVVAAQQAVTKLESTIQKYETAMQANSHVVAQLQKTVDSVSASFQATDSKLKGLSAQQKINQRQLSALNFEIGQQGSATSSFEDQLADNQQQTQQIEENIARLKQELASTKKELNQVHMLGAQRQAQLQTDQQWLAVANEKQRQTKRQCQESETQLATIQNQLDALVTQINSVNQTQEQRESEKIDTKASLEQLTAYQQQTQQQLDSISKQVQTRTVTIDTKSQQLDRQYELQQASLRELDEVHAKVVQLGSQLDHSLNRLAENYSMTLDEAKQNLSDLTPEEISGQLKLLKRGLDEIGPVNIGAIEEYDRVNQRYSFLHDQQHDLLSAKEQLNDTMQEMDEEVKTRFNESYQQVATSFSHIFAQMFGGGQAKLVLTDPDNLLETGIDIMAQPPGKKNQQLSLLSGGEKALTAITLLFAILEVRPVPFAILDETEAALDEANVNRFAHYLSTYGDRGPQFIVVTHRKGTMVNANVLYGVTMQESGVSKMVSVSLEDVPV